MLVLPPRSMPQESNERNTEYHHCLPAPNKKRVLTHGGTSLQMDDHSSTTTGAKTATRLRNAVNRKPTDGGNDEAERQRPVTSNSGQRRVQHAYHDCSFVVDEEPLSRRSTTQASRDFNFVEKLHYLLSDMEKEHLEHIASWQPHGRCFVVRRTDLFEKKILPVWFRQTKFASFQRQLNLYGFNRITSGLDKNGYYHERFLRGKRFLAKQIQRMKVKGNGGRKASSPLSEPKFYEMPFLKPESSTESEARNAPVHSEAQGSSPTSAAPPNSCVLTSALVSGLLSSYQQHQNQSQGLQLIQQPPPVYLLQHVNSSSGNSSGVTPPAYMTHLVGHTQPQIPVTPQISIAAPQQYQQQLTMQQSALLLAQLASTIASMNPPPPMQQPPPSTAHATPLSTATQQITVNPQIQHGAPTSLLPVYIAAPKMASGNAAEASNTQSKL